MAKLSLFIYLEEWQQGWRDWANSETEQSQKSKEIFLWLNFNFCLYIYKLLLYM